jgi:hypothetical protein
MELMDKEKIMITNRLREEYRTRIEELEANILAYQDLLMTKEEEID